MGRTVGLGRPSGALYHGLSTMEAALPAQSTTAAAIPDLIRALERQRYAAMIAADIPTLDALLSENLLYTHSNASVDDKASYLEKVASKYFDYLELDHPEEQLVVTGSTVLVLGRMEGRIIMEGKTERRLNNRALTVWVEEAGQWKMVAFQPTPIPPA